MRGDGSARSSSDEAIPSSRAPRSRQSRETETVLVRFSTVLGERGSPDTARDVGASQVRSIRKRGTDSRQPHQVSSSGRDEFPDLGQRQAEPHFGMPQAGSERYLRDCLVMPEIPMMCGRCPMDINAAIA